jgi:hypothetical protein
VRAEKGCIEYGAAVDLDPALKFQTAFGPDTFVVVEKWESAGRIEGACCRPAHGGLRGQDQGFHRQPRDPHPETGVNQAA